ncbi:MAG: IclR family transcriptional regulator [Hydrogenophaga sp.]|jgi:IclR family transcriptional regulator, acetate operon repressor|uniref:IclR family transcriptional regulator n=1 Tax=unclassified Hydrogenophaga TaxID=2610897 RepID=UPI00083D2D75|nr:MULTISPECIES: IclR family transcriptional regulator [unclassified Hydrogenophaga]MBT9467500.1 IclR family transcriptional regulator [Hydrogenophaga sp.]MDP2771509.1 IclR family transcriptional regulator [Giesbergeria sp.]PKO64435.1 MAG: IclR family transcriptional regulator [Betaproteobacteria bacterium HGW-Betaproteobacteria-16]
MGPTEKPGESVRAVDRALEILMAFTATDHQLTAGELLKRVDLSRPTLYRLLRTLEHSGFIVSSGDPQRFELGPSVAHLAHVWSSSLDIATLAQPMLRRLWDQTGETVALLVHQGNSRICVAELPSAQPLSFKRGLGYREDVTLGASGRAILAHVPTPESYLNKSGETVNVSAYLDRLQQIREQGYAISRDELIQGAVAVAVPFFLGNDKVMGSLAVFGPGVRVDQARVSVFVTLLKEEARKLSQALGQR